MAFASVAAAAIPTIVGGLMANNAQNSANAMNMNLNQQNMAWQTMMSNTAVQRRMADLKAAGINPILAAGQSANQPNYSPIAMGAQGGIAAGQMAANLPSEASSAADIAMKAAQTRNITAQARKTEWETGGDVIALNDDGTPDFSRSSGGAMGNLNAAQAYTNVQQGNALVKKILQDKDTSLSAQHLNEVNTDIAGINKNILQTTRDWLVREQIADTKTTEAGVAPAEANAQIYSGPKGAWIRGLDMALSHIPGSAAAASNIGGMIRAGRPSQTQTSTWGPGGVYKGGSVTTTGPQ